MTQAESYKKIPKIEELESIRGLAALLVVFHHTPIWNPLFNARFIYNGYLMVDLFFVLSGFVIFNAYNNKITTKKELARFQFLRFGRLYPVHLFFLLAYLIVEITKYIAQQKFGLQSHEPVFSNNNATAFIDHLFLIQAFQPEHLHSFNQPSWSISTELYTYLLFGLIVLFFKQLKYVIFACIAVISLIMLLTGLTCSYEFVLRCFAGFFTGCLTATAIKYVTINLSRYASTAVFIVIILFLQLKITQQFDECILFLTAALIATLILSPNGLLNSILKINLFEWLGTISYSIYMSHAVIIWIVNNFFRVALKRPEIYVNGENTPQLSIFESLIGYLVIITAALLVSAFTYNFIEKPMREKSRQIAFKWR